MCRQNRDSSVLSSTFIDHAACEENVNDAVAGSWAAHQPAQQKV